MHLLAQLRINEVCSANGSALFDFEQDTPDYIELVNSESTTISTGGFYLSDSNNPLKWALPDTEMAPGAFLLIYCSDKDLYSPELHSNFGIDSNGETIRLNNELGQTEDFVIVPELHSDDVYARNADGEFVLMDTPTPLAENANEEFDGYAEPPVFSRKGGFYNQPFPLEISSNDALRFTTNNLYPVNDYLGEPISIDSTMSVTAQSFSAGKLPSRIVGATYFMNEDHTLPVVAIIADSLELFDETDGIYMLGPNADPEWPHFGGNIWNNKHILSWIEVYQERERVVAQLAESRMHGGQSARNQPQRPFRFIAKDRLGTDRFYAQLHKQSDQSIFKKFVVRNGGSDYHRVHISDSFIERQVTEYGLDLEAKGSEPCVFYLNGYYWGFMDIQRVIDDWFIWSVTDFEEGTPIAIMEDDSLVIKGNIASFDVMLDFIESNPMDEPQLFQQAEELLDISNFTDYIITETFWNNIDWPANNVKSWRPLTEGGKWRYILFDMDVSLSSFGFAKETANGLQRFLTELPENKHYRLFDNLYENLDYRIRFLNRYADLCNSAFSREAITTNLRKHVAIIWEEKGRHHDRWGSSRFFWETFWLYPRAYEFGEKRTDIAVDQVKEAFDLSGVYDLAIKTSPANAGWIDINSLDSIPHGWTGKYFNDIPIDVSAYAAAGFVFSHWETRDGQISSPDAFTTSFDTASPFEELTAVFSLLEEDQLFAWPNPSDGLVNILFETNIPQSARIIVANSQGMVTRSIELPTIPGVNTLELNDLPKGVHFVQILLEEKKVGGRLIVR